MAASAWWPDHQSQVIGMDNAETWGRQLTLPQSWLFAIKSRTDF
jgi:hypothetical protein